MCELLVFTFDRINEECPYQNAACLKRGDVVELREDGHPHSDFERKFFEVIALPGVTLANASGFVAREPEVDPSNPSRMLQRRAFFLDLDAPRPRNLAQLLALKRRRHPLPDPNVL